MSSWVLGDDGCCVRCVRMALGACCIHPKPAIGMGGALGVGALRLLGWEGGLALGGVVGIVSPSLVVGEETTVSSKFIDRSWEL